MDTIMELLTQPLTFALIAGVVGTVVAALINRASWRGQTKALVSLGVALGLTVIGVLAQQFPAQWEAILAGLAVVIGVMQVVYTALKPTGIFKHLEALFVGRDTDPTGKLTDN